MLTTIKEGSCKVCVDIADVPSKDQEVFYNPKMEVNRTLSILLLQALNKKKMQLALPLAGSGIRAIRFLKELPKDMISYLAINDGSKKAVELINKNLQENNLQSSKVEVFNKEANKFLEDSHGFDYIDIDPFGSPNFLLDSAIRRLSRQGILAVTATDTGALAGRYPNACKQKYWAKPLLCPHMHELGLRILIRKIIMMGMHQGKALTPIFSYHQEHYYRVFFSVKKGKTAANALFKNISKQYQYCPSCSYQHTQEQTISFCPECKHKLSVCGPLYDGSLQDAQVLNAMIELKPAAKIEKLLLRFIEDNQIPLVGGFDTHEMCQQRNFIVTKISSYKEELEEQGYKAVPSATNGTTIKTNAPFSIVKKLFEAKR